MRFKIFTNLTLCLLITNLLSAQWTDETYFNQIIMDVYPFEGDLFIVGGFTEREGNTCYWSAKYNGSSYVNQSTLIGGSGLDEMAAFNNELYCTGSLSNGFSTGLSVWSGSTWNSGASFNTSHSGIFADEFESTLYVGGDFGVLSKKVSGLGSFTEVATVDGFNKSIQAIDKYNGDIIIGGNFDVSSTDVTLNNVARLDGTTLAPMGDGVNGDIFAIAVYNSELYVGGKFSEAGGQSAKYIAKWDGSSWSNVGGSVTVTGGNGIRDMIVHNNKLYVAGDFSEIGGVSAKYVAAWDGTNWEDHSLNMSNDFCQLHYRI